MDYIKAIISGLAAIFVAEFAVPLFLWPILNSSKATGLAALKVLLFCDPIDRAPAGAKPFLDIV
jgi:hypothetical protein